MSIMSISTQQFEDLLEFSQPDDRYLDFCLWNYEPLANPAGKFRSINLLYQSFLHAGVDEGALRLCQAIRGGFGDWRTVWGVKLAGGHLSWELYFYDYARLDRSSSITKLLAIMRQFVDCDLQLDEHVLYFMFSIDIDNALFSERRPLDSANIYIGNIGNFGSMTSSGICYELSSRGLTLQNLYYFFDAATGKRAIADKLRSSIHLQPERLELQSLLFPELCDCRTIVVANKKHNDGIYFSGIDIEQLLDFMELLDYPAGLVDYTVANRDRLAHLSFDVGIDFRMVDGDLKLLKSSYYGVF
jgi:hypothetical protein